MKKLYSLTLSLLAGASMLLSSCSDSKDKNENDDTLIDIVTLVSTGDAGSLFTFQQDGDSPLISLTSNYVIDSQYVKPGERMMIAYVPTSGVAYQSGPINLVSYRDIINGKCLEGTASEYSSWGTEEQQIYSLWRTGNYINVHAGAYVKSAPKRYILVADKETLNDALPQLYLLFETDNNQSGALSAIYASFDISDIWNRSNVKGLRVHVNNAMGSNTIAIDKDSKDNLIPTE
jgi:hypothetical protein